MVLNFELSCRGDDDVLRDREDNIFDMTNPFRASGARALHRRSAAYLIKNRSRYAGGDIRPRRFHRERSARREWRADHAWTWWGQFAIGPR